MAHEVDKDESQMHTRDMDANNNKTTTAHSIQAAYSKSTDDWISGLFWTRSSEKLGQAVPPDDTYEMTNANDR